jgi:ParB/RepB/Spo0J family partition protein
MKYSLINISPEDIDFNLDNPRGESPEDIQNDKSFVQLKDSVFKYGVLVPIVVHRQKGKAKRYLLVDGERRVRAALATKREKVPAHVAIRKNELDEQLQAFHIHTIRDPWRPVAEARALKKMQEEIRIRHPKKTQKEIRNELQELTGYSDDRFKTMIHAIRFPDSVLKEVEDGKLNWSHLIQIEESFIEPISNQFPDLLKEFSKDEIRQRLLNKARHKILSSTRALMSNITPLFARAESKEEREFIEKRISEFINKDDETAEAVLKKYEAKFPESGKDTVEFGKELLDRASELNSMVVHIQAKNIKVFPDLARNISNSLKNLKKSINSILNKLDKRQ